MPRRKTRFATTSCDRVAHVDVMEIVINGVPLFMVGLFHGKFPSKMDDDWGYPYDSGNLHMVDSKAS